MSSPDDSALLHAKYYDPAKARAYYLRTRQLKGRGGPSVSGGQVGQSRSRAGVVAVRGASNEARRNELAAQKAALNKRLDRLKKVLEELVNAAKARSGVKDKSDSDTDPKETAAKNESKKKGTPLTAKQKREKADKARKEYEKTKGSGPSQDIAVLQAQVQDIRAKIETAIKQAREKSAAGAQEVATSAQSKPKTASKGR